jgi:ADP-sugar diphosphatase
MSNTYRHEIENELHSCMSQLKSLRVSNSLFGHTGVVALGYPYQDTPGEGNSVTVYIQGYPVIVKEDKSMTKLSADDFKKIFEMKAFHDWLSNLDPAFMEHCTLTTIYIQSVDFWGPRVGFLKFKTDMAFKPQKEGDISAPVSSIVFMRGGAVAMLMILECGSQKFALTTVQPRVPAGRYDYCEIPAGMIDGDKNVVGVAAKEIKEETGIGVSVNDLADLLVETGVDNQSVKGVFPSVGGCDEFLRFYLYIAKVTPAYLESLQGKCTGVLEEGEKITLKIVPLHLLAAQSPDMKTFTALYLYGLLSPERIKYITKDRTGSGGDVGKVLLPFPPLSKASESKANELKGK